MSLELQKAVNQLCDALKTDSSYRESWKANIAMAMYDEYSSQFPDMDTAKIHKVCNDGADRFLNLLTHL